MSLLLLAGLGVLAIVVAARARLARTEPPRPWADVAEELAREPGFRLVPGAEPVVERDLGDAVLRVLRSGGGVLAELRASSPHAFGVGPADGDSLDAGIGDVEFDAHVAIRGHRSHALRWLDAANRAKLVAAVDAGLSFSGRSWRRVWPDPPSPQCLGAALAQLREASALFREARTSADLRTIAATDPAPGVRRSAWLAIVADPCVTHDGLRAALSHPDRAVCRAAARALATRTDAPEDLEALLLASDLDDPDVLTTLGAIGTLRSLRPLQGAAAGPRWSHTTAAARAALAAVRSRFPLEGTVAVAVADGAVSVCTPDGGLSAPE
jgi:hypothetical protein